MVADSANASNGVNSGYFRGDHVAFRAMGARKVALARALLEARLGHLLLIRILCHTFDAIYLFRARSATTWP